MFYALMMGVCLVSLITYIAMCLHDDRMPNQRQVNTLLIGAAIPMVALIIQTIIAMLEL